MGYHTICYHMEGNVEGKPKTSINNIQPTDESAELVESKIRQFGKGFRSSDDDKKEKKERSTYLKLSQNMLTDTIFSLVPLMK